MSLDQATVEATILLRLRVKYTRPIPSMADGALLNAALHLERRTVDRRSGCELSEKCSHNTMIHRPGDNAHTWKCADCGYLYGKEIL